MWKIWKQLFQDSVKTTIIFAYLQTMIKIPVKFQKDRYKTVGVALTRFPLQTRNHTKNSKLKMWKKWKKK